MITLRPISEINVEHASLYRPLMNMAQLPQTALLHEYRNVSEWS
jgi:hypothetical protein